MKLPSRNGKKRTFRIRAESLLHLLYDGPPSSIAINSFLVCVYPCNSCDKLQIAENIVMAHTTTYP